MSARGRREDRPPCRGLDPEDTPVIGKNGAFGRLRSAASSNFGRVKATAIVAMADGSAQRVAEGATVDVLSGLATVAGGEKVSPGDW